MRERTKTEHRDDRLNRLLTDPLADMLKVVFADRQKYQLFEVVHALRIALFYGLTERGIENLGLTELQAERTSWVVAAERYPQNARRGD